jgi:hypothetical protein
MVLLTGLPAVLIRRPLIRLILQDNTKTSTMLAATLGSIYVVLNIRT